MKYLLVIMVTSLSMFTSAFGEDMSSDVERVVNHHLAATDSQDLEMVMLDYAEDAVLITPDGVFKGKQAIQESFSQLLGQEPFPVFTVTKEVYEGDIGYITWTLKAGDAPELHGSDTFILRDGKIIVQTVVFLQ